MPLAIGALAMAALAGGYATLRWRKARQTLGEARWYCTQAKQAAGAGIVELDKALKADRDKAAYDQLSYAAADVEQLAEIQRISQPSNLHRYRRSSTMRRAACTTGSPAGCRLHNRKKHSLPAS